MKYVLVLIVGTYGGQQMTLVPGYTHFELCRAAGEHFLAHTKAAKLQHADRTRAFCIPGPDPAGPTRPRPAKNPPAPKANGTR